MCSVTIYVGLDYHQLSVQVCVLDSQGKVLRNISSENCAKEIAATVAVHGDRVFAAIESCTGAAHLADELIARYGWSVDLAHPGYVARIKQSPDKTDFGDARLLADLERVGYLPKVWLAPEAIRELRRVVRFRQQLADERRNIKLRVGALLREHRLISPCRRWTRAWLHWLLEEEKALGVETRWVLKMQMRRLAFVEQELQEVEKHLEILVAADPIVQALLQYPGIGLITAVTLRAEIGRFDRFRTGKQMARFCGLSPRNASSGQRQADAGLIKAGNPELRRVLIEAAHRLRQWDPRWRDFSRRLRASGKPACVVVAAVANRFVRWLYHQMQPCSTA